MTINWCSDPPRAVELEGLCMAGVRGLNLPSVMYGVAFDSLGYRFIFLTTAVTNSVRLMEAMSEVKA